MSDENFDDAADTSIGFVFDAFGDNFRLIDSKINVFEESVYKLSSKIEALDLGMVYSIELNDKKINAISTDSRERYKSMEKSFNKFRNIILSIVSFSFILNLILLFYIAGA
tara:strand:- start:3662 stop:3994 length:333 start_codon:yes stop_codon:yes gene_type:complete